MARDLIAYLMILSLFMTASGCHKESDVVISHSSRDKLVDVSQQVRVFNPDGCPCHPHMHTLLWRGDIFW